MRQAGWKMILVGATIALVCNPCGLRAQPVLDSSPTDALAAASHSLLPVDYWILNERSIFLKGQLIRSPGRPGGVEILPILPEPIPQHTGLAAAREESLVFDGVTKADAQIVGFIEDRSTSAITMVKVGDSIAGGRVTAINLDGMNYSARGSVVHVQVGENLLGNRASIADTLSAASTTLAADVRGTYGK